MGGGGSKAGPKEILIIGLDNAGKTTFFKQLLGHFKLSATDVRVVFRLLRLWDS